MTAKVPPVTATLPVKLLVPESASVPLLTLVRLPVPESEVWVAVTPLVTPMVESAESVTAPDPPAEAVPRLTRLPPRARPPV